MSYRITYISAIDAKPQTRRFDKLSKAQEDWRYVYNDRLIRHAVFVELTDTDTIKMVLGVRNNKP